MPTLSGTPTEQPAQGVSTNVSSGVFGSFNMPTTGARRCLIAFVGWYDLGGGDLTALTYGGQAMTEVVGIGGIANEGRIEVWRLVNPPTGSNNFSLTLSQTVDEIFLMACGWVDVDQTTPIGETPTQFVDNGTTSTLSATLATNNVLVGGTYWWTSGNASTTQTDTLLTEDDAISGSKKASQYSTDGSMMWTYSAATDALSAGVELNHDGGFSAVAGLLLYQNPMRALLVR